MLFENFGDRPFFSASVEGVTVAAMARVVGAVMGAVAGEVRLPFGVNVLRNDAASAVAIAAATGAAFIRVNVHTGAMLTDQGVVEGRAAETLRLRAALAPETAIFADHFVKHALPLAPVDERQAAKDLRLRGLADAVVVSGAETGAAVDPRRLLLLRELLPDAPLVVGSGVTAENAASFDADAVIAGTSLKRGGVIDAPVEPGRVDRLVRAVRARGAR
jgi:membrane complex biogenesis BtpA family protein